MSFWKRFKKDIIPFIRRVSFLVNAPPLKRILKNKGSKVFLLLFSALMISSLWGPPLISCTPQQQPQSLQIGPSIERESEEGRDRSRLSFRSRRVNCRDLGSGGSCKGNSECENICDDIFSRNTSKEKCLNLNEGLVADFYEIFSIMEDGDSFEDINPDSLKCLLNISDTEFFKEVRQLKQSESESFLEVLALDQDLTDILSSEENILEKLLDKLGDDLEAFTEKIDGSSTFIDLIVENDNEEAWDWVMNYIGEECGVSNTYCGPSALTDKVRRELAFFCKTYKDSISKLDELLDSAFFNEEYSNEIEEITECGSNGDEKCDADDPNDFLGASSEHTVCNSTNFGDINTN